MIEKDLKQAILKTFGVLYSYLKVCIFASTPFAGVASLMQLKLYPQLLKENQKLEHT